MSMRTRAAIDSLDNIVFVSAASAWEVATKVRLGRLPQAETLAAKFSSRVAALRFSELPITVAHARRAGFLPGPHGDPFDRMLIAQALSEDLVLISNEQIFDQFHVRRLW